jgi:hypothetical protein
MIPFPFNYNTKKGLVKQVLLILGKLRHQDPIQT